MNDFGHYTRWWVNRRSRRAFEAGRTAAYYYHYRRSWIRWTSHFNFAESPSTSVTFVLVNP